MTEQRQSMHAGPRVSVCVSVFNHAAFIRDCLLSVICQQYDADLEILVGDDASTDGSAELLDELAAQYPGLIKVYHHPENLGASQNLQFLIARSSGEFIAHLDGDDFWLPGKLQAQVGLLSSMPDLAAVYTNAIVVSADGAFVGLFNNALPTRFDIHFLLEKGNFLNHSSIMYRAEYGAQVCALQGSFIDYRIHALLADNGLLGFINEPRTAYRAGLPASLTTSARDQVREWYWDAVRDGLARARSRTTTARALASFWEQIFMVAWKRGRWRWARAWAARIYGEYPDVGRAAIVRGTVRYLVYRVRTPVRKLGRSLSGVRLDILHERRC